MPQSAELPRALDMLAKALTAAPVEDRPRILVIKAVTLEHMGDAEAAIEVLQEAGPLAESQGIRAFCFGSTPIGPRTSVSWGDMKKLKLFS